MENLNIRKNTFSKAFRLYSVIGILPFIVYLVFSLLFLSINIVDTDSGTILNDGIKSWFIEPVFLHFLWYLVCLVTVAYDKSPEDEE